jgi:hypothetical protein
MTQEEFIKVLEDLKGYSYEIEGDKIVVTEDGDVYLDSIEEWEELDTIPPDVVFMNNGNVFLNFLKTLPSGVVFMNNGNVFLNFLKTLSTSVEFNNRGYVVLESLTSISPDVVFKNGGEVELDSLFGGRFDEWEGNIDGIDSNRLLNLMIKQGVFI